MDKKTISECERLVAAWVDPLQPRQTLAGRLDLLERVIELLRFEHKLPSNGLDLETFLQARLLTDEAALHYAAPEKYSHPGCGTPPVLIQPKLLMYLLIRHQSPLSVYDIITNFIARVRPELSILDFKKTRTGVTRCYTNTRFAAHNLRDYGFLKFTSTEAYKTWLLSLPGFVVASAVYKSRDWSLPPSPQEMNFDLHRDIRNAWEKLSDYDRFVDQLSEVCKPNTEVFATFEGYLQKAYKSLGTYWAVLRDPKLTQKERRSRSLALIKALEADPETDTFCVEYSSCVQIEDVIVKATTPITSAGQKDDT